MTRDLLTGNAAAAWGARLAEVDYVPAYPITPQAEIIACPSTSRSTRCTARARFPQIGKDSDSGSGRRVHESDRVIELGRPEELYGIAALLRDTERYVIEAGGRRRRRPDSGLPRPRAGRCPTGEVIELPHRASRRWQHGKVTLVP
jgi:hypothetical protein